MTTVCRPRCGWSPPPVLVVLRPTELCNLRCRICFERGADIAADDWGEAPAIPELDAAAYESLLAELVSFNSTFYITGGEPLMAPPLIPILRFLKAHGRYVSLNTNGVLLREKAAELVRTNLDKIIVSLDGPPAIHDSIRGPSFAAIAAGIAAINEEKRKLGVGRPFLRVQCVISSANAEALAETAVAVGGLGLGEIRFQHPMFTSLPDRFHIADSLKQLSRHTHISTLLVAKGALDAVRLKDHIRRVAEERPGGVCVTFEPVIRQDDIEAYYTEQEQPFVGDCLSPWRRLVVSSRGEMGPCLGIYLGRWPERTAAAIWSGPEFRKLRRQIRETGLFQHCLRCCHREYYPPRVQMAVN